MIPTSALDHQVCIRGQNLLTTSCFSAGMIKPASVMKQANYAFQQ